MSTRRSERDENRRVHGQNFLRDPKSLRRMVEVARVGREDLVFEVGAGEGVLTEVLAERARYVVTHEVDPHLARALEPKLRRWDNVELDFGDFLRVLPAAEPFKVVANIPYAITSAIVDWCLDARYLTSATLMTQLEYARKRSGWYGRWSQRTVETWPLFSWELCGKIPREHFRPVPKVDSGVLHITRREKSLLHPKELRDYEKLVALGFTGIGGSLRASLSKMYTSKRVSKAFDDVGLRQDTVVAFAHPDVWIDLYRALNPSHR
ncbi:23S rRNA (adenine(2058)-N(6))-methyltransferase Erm(O) [Allokutzneria multivorans]|uniref:23S rRNA (Adenine(2058)-N(6))-methyltransferase Erm(O) n=1 Tax=Allokutzneria multivorans TaxID=1142134 RepID=A0ABP7U6A5_9PSEU